MEVIIEIEDYKEKLLEQLSLEQLQQLVSLIESLKELNKENIKEDQIPYIGKDGKEYYSYKELVWADGEYFQTHFPVKGDDGKQYTTMGELVRANIRYWNSIKIIKNINNINDIDKIDSEWREYMISKMSSPRAADFSQPQVARADYQKPMSDSEWREYMISKMSSPRAADFSQPQAARTDYQKPMSDFKRIISPDAAGEQSNKKR